MYEYRIVIQHGQAKPYSLWSFNTYEACYFKLMEFINDRKHSARKEYFVENDFFENEYPAYIDGITRYRIEFRDVSKWEILSQKIKSKRNENNKIVNLF